MRVLRRALAAVLVLLVAAGTAAGVAAYRTLPRADDTDRIPGLAAPVSVLFDADGVPRIRAGSLADAFAALGYLHARDRLAQMDLMRRAAAGELAALLGPRALPLDRSMRVLGLREAAVASVAHLPSATRGLLEAYARGVNALIAHRGRFAAPEFVLLGRPRPWTPVDSMLWAETMGLYLSGNLRTELARLVLLPRLGRDRTLALSPSVVASAAGPVPTGTAAGRLAAAALRALPRFPAPFTEPATASNGWAVDGRHSQTGAPLLAGDPHLAYGLPCLWYLARIDTPDETLAGATAPGIPFLVLGRNRRIAWTFTTAAADTEDVFVERVLDRDHYAGPAGPLPFAHRIERIAVRGRPDVVLDVRITRHGPVISDGGEPAAPGPGLALAASIASLAPDNTAAAGLLALDQAGDVDAAGRAAVSITAPVQNLVVADARRIALFTTGRVPVRAAGDGTFPVFGADTAHDWTGWASGAALPRIVDPPSGMIANANEPVAAPSAAFMGRDAPPDWRARRINELLHTQSRFSPADFVRDQGDVRDLFLARLMPALLPLVTARNEPTASALRALDGWDATMSADRAEPLIAIAWVRALEREILRSAGDPRGTAAEPDALLLAAVTGRTPALCGGDGCDALASATLRGTVAALAATHGASERNWAWGAAHRARFVNPLWGAIPVLGRLRGAAIRVGGDNNTVDAQAMAPGSFASVHGASFRGVYDLADLDASRFVIATGESGNPFSRHLLDFAGRWQQIGSVTLAPLAPDAASGRLLLTPAATP